MPDLRLSRAAVLPFVGALSLGLAACGGGNADDGPCATVATTADPAVRPISLAEPTVELVSAGTAPLQPLRAAPNRTDAQHTRLTATTTVLSRMAERADAAPTREDQSVTLTLAARYHCTDEKDVALTLEKASAADASLSGDIGKDAGSRGGLTLDANRAPVSLRLWPATDAPDTARSIVENTFVTALQNMVALPAEPVGTGASWRTTRTLLGATTLTQTVTATLRSRTADTVEVDLSVDEAPTGSEYTVPGTGKKLQIARYTALGRGTATIDLRRALPVGGSIDVRGARELVGGDATRPLVQQTRYQLEWSR
ncbi:MAG: hypothetical protein QM728_08720 [Gordonia sp. (in: high G+C Gram-positive bacteria)]|uniref:hypothetical protein n=1 Tax=Gordonia sp. (in: high G+C Gram-positive bacteria) TaxID=84139 RepID=UPI0039E2EE3D